MPTFTECLSCGRRLQVPEQLEASPVQCPSCGAAFTAPVRSAAVAEVAVTERALAPLPNTWRTCPYCREEIPHEATRCRYCGEAVGERNAPPWRQVGQVRRDAEPHRGKLLLGLGITGLVLSGLYGLCVLGIPVGLTAWALAQQDLRRMRWQEVDPKGEMLTRVGQTCGLVGALLGGAWLFAFLTFFLLAVDL